MATKEVPALPSWVRWATVGSVSVVAGVAAVVSYMHVLTLGQRAGEEWRAWLLPLSVDGLLVAASMVMLVRRRAGRGAGVLPWLGMVLGLGASLGANIAAAEPTSLLDGAVSAWPAVALALAFELLVLVLREVAEDERRRVAAARRRQSPARRKTTTTRRTVQAKPVPLAAA